MCLWAAVCLLVPYWEYKRDAGDCTAPTVIFFMTIGLGAECAIFLLAYLILLKHLYKFKEELVPEVRKMAIVYFTILIATGVQTLFFFGEIGVLFCQDYAVSMMNAIMSLLWNLPLIWGIGYLHRVNFTVPDVVEYPAALAENAQHVNVSKNLDGVEVSNPDLK